MKLLVLYESLATYFTASLRAFAEATPAEVLVFRTPVNGVAPFEFEEDPRIRLVDRETIDITTFHQMIADFAPDAVFCGGWVHKPYLDACRRLRPKVPVVLGFDNWWIGSPSQRAKALLARPLFAKTFNRCFVPGEPQRNFALRLGFSEAQIMTGGLCCDQPHFRKLYERAQAARAGRIPRRFLYVGRYSPEKGIDSLWQAFKEVQDESPSDWELWCLGKGSLQPVEHHATRHFGFIQPDALQPFVDQCGVFVLPSRVEPWGVVVHEFAAAGFPLICSDRVGAAAAFVREGENGLRFPHDDRQALKQALRRFMAMSDAELQRQSQRSVQLAAQHTPALWSARLNDLIQRTPPASRWSSIGSLASSILGARRASAPGAVAPGSASVMKRIGDSGL